MWQYLPVPATPRDQAVVKDVTLTATAGKHLDMKCQPNDSLVRGVVTWQKDNTKLNNRISVSSPTGNSMIIPEVLPFDAGVYRCNATTPHGVEERSFDVTVTGREY